ncbi:MAG: class I SAM-dependent methyltransferase [Erysipelotrichaceae bacterium]|nr:class I SAM-dependent methyltransferase [Erysipelotrichaceae bacterium]
MAHYFENDKNLKTDLHTVSFSLDGKNFTLESDAGVFSKDKLDTGTRILLETVLKNSMPAGTVLDLGCGIGPVGVVLSAFWNCQVTGIDVNERACALASLNYQRNHVKGTVLCQDGVDDGEYDCILLNPPIRAGKEVIYRLFDQSAAHLNRHGALWIVMRKQHGAQSAVNYLQEALRLKTERMNRDKGFWIVRAVFQPESGQ